MENQTFFYQELKNRASGVELILKKYMPDTCDAPAVIAEAMNYSVMVGGKRLRPILMQEFYTLFGGTQEMIEPFMAAIEMIHTYSLVHDDLPAMDNDEYRRGKKTTWAVYGDAMGILAGDGLLNWAFETALKAFDYCETPEDYRRVRLCLAILFGRSGINGMIGGQVADMLAEEKPESVNEEALSYIHTHKTGALIEASMLVGAVLAGASEEAQREVSACAMDIGLAFQIQDDILDVEGDSEELGKQVGSDAANGKQTYVTLKGIEQAKEDVKRLNEEACSYLSAFPGDPEFMENLMEYLIVRRS